MSMANRHDVIVIGAGHNGLVADAYLARAGLDVLVVEASDDLGGCIHTIDLPDGAGRLELGAYEVGGIVGSGVEHDLELTARWGLQLIDRHEMVYAPHADGTAVALHQDLTTTVDLLGSALGTTAAEQYRAFARWSCAVVRLMGLIQARPAPSLEQLATLSRATLGTDGERLIQAMLAPASTMLTSTFESARLQGVLAHWSTLSHLDPS